MKQIYRTPLLFNLLLLSCTSHTSPKTVSATQNNMEWEVYENRLTTNNDTINFEQLQGLWSAYKILNKEGERVSIVDVKNFTLEIRDSTYRSNEELRFKPFLLKQNKIYIPITGDLTIIEVLTNQEFIMTYYENDSISTRYYFQKVVTK
ncbi:hypothetical protein [Pontibacter harenae]|uniref:hypothetical protein n=1 Tax=Pontibacter harenae TaxID=2894083 RepID=UPI001E35D10F|nr:hypothetical protein [Pontibacter harenae]MCC9167970.1 hypothetical protein [Pontibacter harenae]